MNTDIFFLKETLRLAKRAMGNTFPNPLVGAVIVKNRRIIARGYHKKAGLSHAEIETLKKVFATTRGATLYVNLEPCAHFGRTPPCSDAIIAAGITRIVCATPDPNPINTGKGIAKLQKAGVTVEVGFLEKEARRLNEAFFTFHEKKRPFIALKFAASLDGKIATRTGDSKWITDEKARAFARVLRGQYQAVLVGINTVLADNPHLGVQTNGYKDPLRIIIDPTLRIRLDSLVLRDKNILIATTSRAEEKKRKQLHNAGFTVILVSEERARPESDSGLARMTLTELLEELRKREIISILVEGGGKTLGSFVDAKLVDKVYAFHAPMLIGGKDAVSAIEGEGISAIRNAIKLQNITFRRFGDNMVTIGYPMS